MPAVLVRLQAAGLDERIGLQAGLRDMETLLPVRAFRLEPWPAVMIQFIKYDRIKSELVSHFKNAEVFHHRPGVAHPAAVANGDRAGAILLQQANQCPQHIRVGGPGCRIVAVVVRLEEHFLASQGWGGDQLNRPAHALGTVFGPDEGHPSIRRGQGGHRRRRRRLRFCRRAAGRSAWLIPGTGVQQGGEGHGAANERCGAQEVAAGERGAGGVVGHAGNISKGCQVRRATVSRVPASGVPVSCATVPGVPVSRVPVPRVMCHVSRPWCRIWCSSYSSRSKASA